MHRGTRAALYFWSSVRNAVGLLPGVILLLVPVAVRLRGVVALLRGVVLLLVPVAVRLRGVVALLRGVVLLFVHVVAHLPRVAALPDAVAAEPQFLTTSSNAELKGWLSTVAFSHSNTKNLKNTYHSSCHSNVRKAVCLKLHRCVTWCTY